MDKIHFSKTDSSIHIDGFPDAVKVIKIDDHPQSERLADLGLHQVDLEFAESCMFAINQAPEEPRVIRQALWRSAIIHFIKCFGANKRFQLNIEEVLSKYRDGLEVFQYFYNLRNKHFVHDVNSYTQSTIGAILNNGNENYKIDKIINLTFMGETLEKDNYSNLLLLIQKTKAWVNQEFDNLCKIITIGLEKENYETLSRREAIQYKVPGVYEVGKKRIK